VKNRQEGCRRFWAGKGRYEVRRISLTWHKKHKQEGSEGFQAVKENFHQRRRCKTTAHEHSTKYSRRKADFSRAL